MRSAGQIYGSTLGRLVDAGNHDKLHAAALTATDSWTPYNDAPPYTYNPYPAYNSEGWSNTNKGKYVPCDGPNGKVRDVLVFSGHPEALSTAPMGSWHPLNIDNNLCFERETRLAAYGFTEDANETSSNSDWDNASWGALQDFCFEKNSDRYVSLEDMPHITGGPDISVAPKSPRQEETLNTSIADRKVGPKGQKDGELMPKSRTALLLRSYSGKTYTENDKQNIRSLVTELSLRSGGEYQVYLLVQIKDSSPLGTSSAAHDKALQDNVPKEFWDMTVLWDDTEMKTWYPQIPKEINNAHQSQWLSVQKFSEEHPQYDYVWNWELDSRYTGHHYNLLEKLAIFAGKQPRKGLWERNERYYIPALYSDYYDTKFRQTVEKAAGVRSIWGAQPSANMTPTGPTPPTSFQKDDYSWGVGEEADYITLAPIFNPVYSNWIGRNDVWGYGGQDNTTRRATIGTQSRCSRALLHAMHEENVKGNHVSSEMTPQTVAILHGFKAVYAPIPIYIDREWDAKSLEKWFNPGPRGESGSCQESPFGWGLEGRFHGTTWYYRAEPPMRLFFNWMGWEDSGIGGAEVGLASSFLCSKANQILVGENAWKSVLASNAFASH